MEERELPVGWELAQIGELCELKNGRAFKAQDWKEEGLPIVRIQNLNKRGAPYNYFQGEVEERFRLRGGELLFAWSGTPGSSFGAHIWKGADAVLNQHIFRVDFDRQLIDIDFFRYAINQKLDDLIDTAHGGVGLRHVTKGKFEKTEVCLPPQAEQRRIAAKLDTTLAAVDACRQRLDGVEALLKRFRQAVLAAATSGALTREWREERGRDLAPWEDITVGDLVSHIDAGLNLKCDERPPEGDERGLVKISAVTWGTYNEEESKTLNQDAIISEENRIRPGDFLISRANTIELVGACVIVHRVARKLYLSDKVLRLVMPEEYKPWLLLCLRSPSGRRQIEGLSSGNQLSMRNLAQKNLLSIKIPIPQLDELDAIKRGAQQLFSLADQLEARLTAARKIIERLTPALLAKAFRGELVPQDPNDEPASVLLERIRAARQAEAAASGPSRRGRKKAAANPVPSLLDAAPVPPDRLANLLRECGALSERALLAASELDPAGFQAQLALERELGAIQETLEDGEVLLEAVA